MKTYIDIGTNSIGGYETLCKELSMDNTWNKIFIEPNPECYEYIEKQIINDVTCKLIKAAASSIEGEFELITRDDMKSDSAATIMGLKFITDSIGSVNQQVPSYNKYKVKSITLDSILEDIDSDEIYIKMDCEGAEYDILESLKAKYLYKIKKLYVEFHAHNDVMRQRRDNIINLYKKLNIEILNWD